jgi:hypothetical protein
MAAARSILHRFTLPERPNQTELPLAGPPSSDLTSAAARLDSRAAHDCFEETQVPPASVPDPAQLMASLARSVGAPHGRINAAVGFGCAGFNPRLAALPFRGMPTPPAALHEPVSPSPSGLVRPTAGGGHVHRPAGTRSPFMSCRCAQCVRACATADTIRRWQQQHARPAAPARARLVASSWGGADCLKIPELIKT